MLTDVATAGSLALVDNARRKRRPKHGGDRQRIDLDADAFTEQPKSDELLALEGFITDIANEGDQNTMMAFQKLFTEADLS